jgi:hypothetical protein
VRGRGEFFDFGNANVVDVVFEQGGHNTENSERSQKMMGNGRL